MVKLRIIIPFCRLAVHPHFIFVDLKKLLGLNWKHAPAHTTLRDILKSVKKQALERYFRQHTQFLDKKSDPNNKAIIAIDGKSFKGSFNHR